MSSIQQSTSNQVMKSVRSRLVLPIFAVSVLLVLCGMFAFVQRDAQEQSNKSNPVVESRDVDSRFAQMDPTRERPAREQQARERPESPQPTGHEPSQRTASETSSSDSASSVKTIPMMSFRQWYSQLRRLDLSPEQWEQIMAIQMEHNETRRQYFIDHLPKIEQLHADGRKAYENNDTELIEEIFRRIEEINKGAPSRDETRPRIDEVLTTEQRDRLAELIMAELIKTHRQENVENPIRLQEDVESFLQRTIGNAGAPPTPPSRRRAR
jgi:hypothetical protein